MRFRWILAAIMAFTLVLPTTQANAAAGLNNTEWVLQELTGWKGKPLNQIERSATLGFAQGSVHGNDGCNTFNGPYEQKTRVTNSLRILTDKFMSTMMACPGTGSALANAYLQALKQTAAYRLQPNTLILVDAKGKMLAKFTQPATTLPGTHWQLISYNNGNALVGSPNTAKMNLVFDKSGQLSGNGGCNLYHAGYKLSKQGDLDIIAVQPIAATRKMCMQPPNLMAEEGHFLHALQQVHQYHRSGNRLDMYDKHGTRMLTLSLLSPQPR